ncbi:hypothetical protein PTSG_12864 [Salpingoeca rosetta]|uniref:Uncharacterized protein n=1 Tax=Salpingoeca rosetta (strain ATCC 50818 / BSB-021) TaxID=946362 RepID=F2UN98_SALR5|nr:uncharacterized protein PTSG_12864 [Salpingoeca rosetta]EGD78597.1 hypothetical protein PTSG_12864 [Salpingoeca rosetta]|eukprot:XP_004989545.1 hypothetical protein PTSG_12864 [Salpingoeca rosetta]
MCVHRHQSRRQRHDARDVRARVRICQADALIDDEREEPIHVQHPCPHPRMTRHGELCHLNQLNPTQAKPRKRGSKDRRRWAPNRCVCVCVEGRCSPFPLHHLASFFHGDLAGRLLPPSPCLFSLPAFCGCWLSVVTVRRRRRERKRRREKRRERRGCACCPQLCVCVFGCFFFSIPLSISPSLLPSSACKACEPALHSHTQCCSPFSFFLSH